MSSLLTAQYGKRSRVPVVLNRHIEIPGVTGGESSQDEMESSQADSVLDEVPATSEEEEPRTEQEYSSRVGWEEHRV